MSEALQKAPWHHGVVSLLITLWSAFGAFDYIATVTRFEPYLSHFPQDLLEYFYALPLWIYVIWAIGIFFGLAGGVALFLHRKIATVLLAISTAGALGSMICSMTRAPPPGGGDPVMSVAIVILALLFVLYAYWMERRGVTR